MQPKGSSAYLQQPATWPRTQPDNPVHTFTPYFFEIHFNIILPSMQTQVSKSISLPQFPSQNHVCISQPLPAPIYATLPVYLIHHNLKD